MSQVTKDARVNPEGQTSDAEVVAFRAQFEARSVLDQLVHEGAQRMLQAAIESDVDEFLSLHAGRCDEAGRRFVVRNGHLPSRAIAHWCRTAGGDSTSSP